MRWAALLLVSLNGCAAIPAIPSMAGFVGSGGVTLYKKATESGSKVEVVLFKIVIHHDTYQIEKTK